MKLQRHSHCQGSTLIIAMITVAVTAGFIAAYYESLIPKYRSAFHAADWHEALHGAEAGVDLVVQKLNQNVTSGNTPDSYDWTGWTLDPTYPLNGNRTLNNPIVMGGSENLTITSLTVDVYTRDASQNPPSYDPWYRVRSTARADLPGSYMSMDKRDARLRRMALTAKNGTLADPHVSRTVEVIIKPRYLFDNAIVTMQSLSLGNSANWAVDSFDSSDTNKSDPGTTAGGVYPASASKVQSNGDIATLDPEPTGVTYGPLIAGNGATVKGDVSTKGGDDPSTTTHENVSGSGGMTQTRISDTFDEDFPNIAAPSWGANFFAPPVGNTGFGTGTKSAPDHYIVNGDLGPFYVKAPASGTGYVEIAVNGSLKTGNGNKSVVDIPPNVYATIYVSGDVNFGNGSINSDSASSQVASHLTVIGTGSSGSYSASGNAVQILSFYGPNYDVSFNGTVTTDGAVVGKSFSISGGGNGGFHYDEALGKGGTIAGWEVASYFDDARMDPQ